MTGLPAMWTRGRRWSREHPGAAAIGEVTLLLATGITSLLLRMRADELAGLAHAIPYWLAVAWTVVLVVPFGARRRFPLATLFVVGVVFAGYRVWLVPEYTVSAVVIFLVVVFAGRDGGPRRDAARGAVLAFLGLVLAWSLAIQEVPEEYARIFRWNLVFTVAYNIFFFLAAWLLGDALRRRHDRERDLEERTAQLEVERELNARRAVVDERLRIARELHDVIAHHVSVMGVQAGAARRTLVRDPDRAATALTTVESSSRQAVDELRRLVGLLRSGEDESLEPVPGVDRLERLIEDTRATGLDVRWRVDGEPVPLADSVGLSVYRVAQEALTNTIKHARARRVEVVVHYRADAVEIEVVDDGVGIAPPGTNGSGHGLAGMRERVALHSGRLETGPQPAGGYRVHATFPARGRAGS